MENLAKKKCVPCEGGIPPLTLEEIRNFLPKVTGWELGEEASHKQIVKKFEFKDFVEAMKFVDQVADIAENEGHHPNIDVRYNKVRLTNYTHAIGGLHENDFILAAKIDSLINSKS